jgi:putative SOS response-associated peptidase YedK
MPVILPEERHDAWLSGEAGKEVLVPFPADRMKGVANQSPHRKIKTADPFLFF